METQLPPTGAQPPIFGPCLLWPNGHPSQLLLSTCESVFGRQLQVTVHPRLCYGTIVCPVSVTLAYHDQTAPTPNFRSMSVGAKWLDGSIPDASWYTGRPWPRPHCVRWKPEQQFCAAYINKCIRCQAVGGLLQFNNLGRQHKCVCAAYPCRMCTADCLGAGKCAV